MKKLKSIIFLLMISFVFVTFPKIEEIKAQGTIYIRADGTIEGTDLIQREGDIFTLTGSVFGGK